jgi:hypothetical protein
MVKLKWLSCLSRFYWLSWLWLLWNILTYSRGIERLCLISINIRLLILSIHFLDLFLQILYFFCLSLHLFLPFLFFFLHLCQFLSLLCHLLLYIFYLFLFIGHFLILLFLSFELQFSLFLLFFQLSLTDFGEIPWLRICVLEFFEFLDGFIERALFLFILFLLLRGFKLISLVYSKCIQHLLLGLHR